MLEPTELKTEFAVRLDDALSGMLNDVLLRTGCTSGAIAPEMLAPLADFRDEIAELLTDLVVRCAETRAIT